MSIDQTSDGPRLGIVGEKSQALVDDASSALNQRSIKGDVTSAEGNSKFFSTDEITKLLKNLNGAERALIEKHATIQARKLGGNFTSEELISEAVLRLYSGERHWRRNYSAVQFFGGTFGVLRSIADGLHKKLSKLDEFSDETLNPNVFETSRVVENRSDLALVLNSFADDYIAQSVILRMADQATSLEIMKELGLTQMEFDTVRRRIRRGLLRLNRTGRL